jgi:hypothetical protein
MGLSALDVKREERLRFGCMPLSRLRQPAGPGVFHKNHVRLVIHGRTLTEWCPDIVLHRIFDVSSFGQTVARKSYIVANVVRTDREYFSMLRPIKKIKIFTYSRPYHFTSGKCIDFGTGHAYGESRRFEPRRPSDPSRFCTPSLRDEYSVSAASDASFAKAIIRCWYGPSIRHAKKTMAYARMEIFHEVCTL